MPLLTPCWHICLLLVSCTDARPVMAGGVSVFLAHTRFDITVCNSQAPVTATPLYTLVLREARCLLLYCLVRTAQFVVSFDDCSWNVDMSTTSKGQAEQLLLLLSLLSAPLYLRLRVCCFAFILYKLVPPRILVREKDPNFSFETLNKVLKHDKTIRVSVKRTCFSLSLGSRV